MSGNLALLALPDDQRLHVQLSPYFYASTLAKLREDLRCNRLGLAIFEVTAPMNAPLIHVAMDRSNTYVLGFRVADGHNWWAFQEPNKPLPSLPALQVCAMGLNGSYTELGLPHSINMRPEKMLTQLATFQGIPDPDFCKAIVLMLFLVAEALRFDSLLMECVRYFSTGTYTVHPERFASTVRNWKAASPADSNVLLPYAP